MADAGAHKPLIVTGMHRSGTSLSASLFEGAGVCMGKRLMGASRGNVRGHFEDLDFYEFHQRALKANGLGPEGFLSEGEILIPNHLRRDAQALVAARGSVAVWGWKDPRSTLFLDFWHEMLPEARYLFVFRRPWEVVDSLFRRGDAAFLDSPQSAIKVWLNYNRRIRDFIGRHPEKCLIRETTQIVAGPAELFLAVRERFQMPLGDVPARCEPDLLIEDTSSFRPAIVRAVCPEAIELYLDLRTMAGSSSEVPPACLPDFDSTDVGRQAMEGWAAVCQRENELRSQAQVVESLTKQREAHAVLVQVLYGEIAQLKAEIERLAAELESPKASESSRSMQVLKWLAGRVAQATRWLHASSRSSKAPASTAHVQADPRRAA